MMFFSFLVCSVLVFQTNAAEVNSTTTTIQPNTTTIITTTLVPTTGTTTHACADDPNTNCHQYIHLCDNAKYVPLLEGFCPKTCGYCGGGSTKVPSTCTDIATGCKSWVKNGFCENNFYSCEQKKQYCPMSCGLCASDACPKKL